MSLAVFSEPPPFIIGLEAEWQGEHLIPIPEVPDFLPRRRGKKYHRRVIDRWIKQGRTAPSHPDGHCKLPITRHLGTLYTSAEKLEWFVRMIREPERQLPDTRQERMRRNLAAQARIRLMGTK